MKHLILVCLACLFAFTVEDKSPQQLYIENYAKIAQEEMRRSGVPASITLAQGLLESNAGRSALASKSNNHFGIKCHKSWKGKRAYYDDDERNECFRVYPSAEASFRDHSDFLRYQDRYKSLFDLDPTDYEAWAKGLKKAGYATDPKYASKLTRIIQEYELYRFDYEDDNREALDVPASPTELESARDPQTGKRIASVDEVLTVSFTRQVYVQNGVKFIYALSGETYQSIAASRGLFLREILSFNDANADTTLEQGTVVYIQRKKKYAAKGVDKYIPGGEGETLRDIAQRFGVREKSLRKINAFAQDYEPSEGDVIKLRK